VEHTHVIYTKRRSSGIIHPSRFCPPNMQVTAKSLQQCSTSPKRRRLFAVNDCVNVGSSLRYFCCSGSSHDLLFEDESDPPLQHLRRTGPLFLASSLLDLVCCSSLSKMIYCVSGCIAGLLIGVNMPDNIVRQTHDLVSSSLRHLGKAFSLGLVLKRV